MKKHVFAIVFVLCASFVLSNVASATITDPPPSDLPTNVDQCKRGGWQNYNGLFKNQGDCVSFVVTDGRNQPDGPASVS